MTNRIAATYDGGSATGNGEHTITFTPATPGARLILVVTSWLSMSAPAGWTEDHHALGFNHVYVYSKISTGAETSVALTMTDARLHAVLHERDDCPAKLFTTQASTTTSSMSGPAVTVPASASGRVFGAVNNPNGSASDATWNNGLVRHFYVDASSSNSAFAHGPMPAAGSRVFTLSNLVVSTNQASMAVVGYGSTDGQAPTTPGNLRTTSITGTAISVEWDPSTDNQAVAGYGLYRNGVKQGADQTATSYTFAGLVAGQSYVLAVDAADAAGNRSPKAQLTVVAEVDVTPPTTPGNLRLVTATLTSLQVAWDASTDNVGVAGYGVWLDGVPQGPDQAELGYMVTRLARGHAYTIAVDAADAAGNRSVKASLTASTLAGADPSAPPGLTATAGREQITVAWGPSDPGGLPIARYEVLLDGSVLTSTTALGYVIEDLEAGSTYEVAVRAVDTGSARGPASTTSVTVLSADWMALASPTFELGGWVGNARDSSGVEWVVEDEEGWSAGAQTIALSADSDSDDGGFSGPGRYSGRIVILSGVAIAPSRVAMLAAQERLTQALSPQEVAVLRVVEAHMTRQARVRLESGVEVTDRGSRAFAWALTVKAPDPRRYAVRPMYAEVEFAPGQTTGSTTITLAGDYPTIPAKMRLIGPVANPVIRLEQLGLEIRARPGTVLPDSRYELTIDLASRVVWSIVPPEVWPEPRPGRRLLGLFPARFALGPGPNTITLSGGVVAGQASGPRLVIETSDAWQ
ncbi:fibronectin type III domain-containing protein [Nonomuraea sp. NPDC005650]|uniref:fibronectin type III domain-containing protein n=1 Tax=Nonomuraea sp. NPDC005650 TaxID=3157045 RepID=UPI0033AB02E7